MAHTIETKLGSASRAAAKSLRALGIARRIAVKSLEIILIWQERSEQRAALRSLGPRMLKDIGVSRSDAARESGKPFWLP